MENEDVAQNILDNTDENASSSQEKLKSALGQFSQNQKRALSVMTVIALAFGAYFLRDYLQLIAIAGVLVYLFRPLYVRFERRWNSGVASALTVLSALAVVIVPLGVILTMAGIQIKEMIDTVSAWVSKTDMSQLGQRILESINAALDRIPFINVDLTPEKLNCSPGVGLRNQ